MIAYERVKNVVLGTKDPTEKKIRFMAMLTSAIAKAKRRPVLIGDSAIEIYLNGTIRTGGDMDVVYDVTALEDVLKSWHFDVGEDLTSWANVELGLAVGVVGDELKGSYERVTTMTTDYGPATIIGLEDLILKRLASAKSWGMPTDLEQAHLLAQAHGDRVDWKYVEEQAEKARIADYVAKLRGMLGSGTSRR